MSSAQKIVILNGSPRQNGNTVAIIDMFQAAAKSKQHTVKTHDLYKLDVRGCSHCDHCKSIADKPECILPDDFSAILYELVQADVIVIASPVYCWSVSSCVSAALERFYAVFKPEKCLLAHKKMIGIFSSGGGQLDGMELCVARLKHLCEYGSINYVGTIEAIGCTTPKNIPDLDAIKNKINSVIAEL